MASRAASDVLAAGLVAAFGSGAPSSVHALATGRDPLEATRAAGSLLLPREQRSVLLLAAAVPVHLALSVGWAAVLARLMPRRPSLVSGAAAGVAIGALDVGLVGRRVRRIRALPLRPQLADHALFGALVALVLRRRA